MPIENRYTLNRDLLEDTFIEGLEKAGFNARGYREGDWKNISDKPETVTKRFTIRPYSDFAENHKPNFIDTFTGLSIWWYKYALRDAYSNKEITLPVLKKILKDLKKETRELGSTPLPKEKDTSFADLKLRQELIAEISKKQNLDVSDHLKDELKKFLDEVNTYRKPVSVEELEWAIRIDRASRKNKIVIAARNNPKDCRIITLNEVYIENEHVIVTQSVASRSKRQPANTAIVFNGPIDVFNETVWSVLTMERLGRDCPDLTKIQTTRDAFSITRDCISVENINILDIKNDWVENIPIAINGTANVSFSAHPAEGYINLTVTEHDGSLHNAKLNINDLRMLCFLSEMKEKDWFDIDIERGAAAGTVSIGDATLTASLEPFYTEPENNQDE